MGHKPLNKMGRSHFANVSKCHFIPVSFPGVGSALSLLYSTYQLIFFLDFSIVKHFEVAKDYLFNV